MTEHPYRDSAWDYRDAGWDGVLPLPPRRKAPVPKDYTGHAGAWPSGADIQAWVDGDEGAGNVALRLPKHVIGLDVDAYNGRHGGETYFAAERRWGRLPSTWRSTNRPTGQGSILLYRVPEGLAWPGELGPGVEIIQFAHRYLVVAPSVHPEGREYHWIGPDGMNYGTLGPSPDTLPELPLAWIDGITGMRLAGEFRHAGLEPGQVKDWLAKHGNGKTMCPAMARQIANFEQEIHDGGSRHEAARDAVAAAVFAGARGHTGLSVALSDLAMRFHQSIANDPTRPHDPNEWWRMVDGAVQLAALEPRAEHDPCLVPALTPVPSLIQPSSAGAVLGGYLNTTKFPPVRYAIDDLIPEGFTLNVGPPKIGKSFLVLEFGLARACGRQALGAIPVRPGPVLYLALEDGYRRLQERARLLQAGAPIPDEMEFQIVVEPGALLPTIVSYYAAHRGEEPMVILDTLGKAMPPEARGESQYQRDYRIGGELKQAVDSEAGASLLVNHHDRKASAMDFVEKVSGTNGLAGAADTVIVVARDRMSAEGLLKVTGRDVREGQYAVKFERGIWRLDGLDVLDAEMTAAARYAERNLGERSSEVLEFVREHGVTTPFDITKELGLASKEAHKTLSRLVTSGRLVKLGRGQYSFPGHKESGGNGGLGETDSPEPPQPTQSPLPEPGPYAPPPQPPLSSEPPQPPQPSGDDEDGPAV